MAREIVSASFTFEILEEIVKSSEKSSETIESLKQEISELQKNLAESKSQITELEKNAVEEKDKFKRLKSLAKKYRDQGKFPILSLKVQLLQYVLQTRRRKKPKNRKMLLNSKERGYLKAIASFTVRART